MRRFFWFNIVVAIGVGLGGCKLAADFDGEEASSAGRRDAGPEKYEEALSRDYDDDPAAAGGEGGRDEADPSEQPSGDEQAAASGGNPSDGAEYPAPEPSSAELTQPSRGAAVALSEDDAVAVVVNRDVGSASVLSIEYPKDAAPRVTLVRELMLGAGSEPYQAVIAPGGDTAYVILRKDQKLVKLQYLRSAPEIAGDAATGSEPTSIALSPSGAYAYVANWVDGTVSEFDTARLALTYTYDLNPALVETGYLGDVQPRAAMAHPRSLVISNDRDGEDGDESIFVTEYYGQQVEPELADGSNSDTRKVGLVYRLAIGSRAVRTINLKALGDIGFLDNEGFAAGCYPNQLQSIALNGSYAYVVSVCASPKGPLGVKVTTSSCSVVEDCAGLNLVEPACVVPFGGAANAICVDTSSVKTSTAPVLSIIDTRTDQEIAGSAENLNARFAKLFADSKLDAGKQRFPLYANDIAFVAGTSVGYVTANGSDAVFRFQVDAKDGTLSAVGGSTNPLIDLNSGFPADKAGRNPIGIAIASGNKKVAFVANDVTRNLSVLDFNTQSVSGAPSAPLAIQTAALPAPGSDEDAILRGKRFFNTGTGRWSLAGQGWGACQSCHGDGLTDNVTWYFARGPRQATSLDGSYASKNAKDQRIFNWTAIFDHPDDFEGNTRDVSGGVGAIVSEVSVPPQTSDRIDFAGLGHAGLNGSSQDAADPANPLGLDPAPRLNDWEEITRYMQTIRSPRAPRNLDADKVYAGRELFHTYGSCQGCHSGAKWTLSTRFYQPSVDTMNALKTEPLAIAEGFPAALLPALQPENQVCRFGGPNPAAFDQIQCVIRPVGTFNVAEDGVGIAELRADMRTPAQGDGSPQGEGRGYNIPSLLGSVTGAPYMHAGNARTLEAMFGATFNTHHQALAPNFLTETEPYIVQDNIDALVQYVLSIDEDSDYPAIPASGPAGGSLCPEEFPAADPDAYPDAY